MKRQPSNWEFTVCLFIGGVAILVWLVRNTLSHGPELTKVEIVNNTDTNLAFWVDTDEPNWASPRQSTVPEEKFIVKG